MKIIIVARGYPTKKYSTYGIFEFDQAKALAAHGHRVVLAAVDLRSMRRWRKWGINYLVKDGVEVYTMNIPLGRVPNFILDFVGKKAILFLYKSIKKEFGSVDIIHSHFLLPSIAAVELSEKEQLPLVITEHSSDMNGKILSKTLIKRSNTVYSQATALIAVSTALSKNIKRMTGYDSICVHNIAATDLFSYKSSRGFDREVSVGGRFVSVGGLTYGKGFDVLITAFSLLLNKYPMCTLEIFGEGKEMKKLKKLVNKNKIDNQVIFRGEQDRQQIAQAFERSDIFVLASRGETFGVAYIEAMSMGLPVIATSCGGTEDFINPEVGILIPVNDIDALLNSMEYMMKHYNYYEPLKISKYVSERFSGESIAEKLTEIYKNILETTYS